MNTQAEAILNKNLEICDAHHHIWDFPNSKYLAEELLEDLLCGHNITSSIYMECGYGYDQTLPKHLAPIGETRLIDQFADDVLSRTNGRIHACKAIVGYADLSRGDSVKEVLECHLEQSERFVGIRHATGWDSDTKIRNAHTHPSEGLMLTSNFVDGIRSLAHLNLTFDAWLYHPQIIELVELSKKVPHQKIILDHVGGILGIASYSSQTKEIFNQWKNDISLAAEQENIFVKLGGLAMSICGMGFNKREKPATLDELTQVTAPYYSHVIDKFGVNRCMFESNFPVDKVGVSYKTLWNSFKYLTKSFSDSEKKALFKGTAEKTYMPSIK
jgi:predicted TIM-barrel fold metal-dependent hydrolase